MRKLIPIVIASVAILLWMQYRGAGDSFAPLVDQGATRERVAAGGSDSAIARAYRQRQSNIQVQGTGTVRRVLADDNDGSRHQRFILELSSGQTLLIAHNIDLASRIAGLSNGDRVGFSGEYEWNDQGGVIHWTHVDPAGRHVAGWLEHEGRRYQ
jgi:Protein of unknown function (DUF3465)